MTEAATGVEVELDDGVLTVTLSNSERANALTRPIYEKLRDLWLTIDDDPTVRVVVFTAVGDRHFCAGADVSALQAPGSFRYADEEWMLTWRQAGMRKPVVVVVNGIVAGGGLGFVTDADVLVASKNARFVDTHVAIGQICGYGALLLVQSIGYSEAVRIGIAGGELSSARAFELGLVNELHATPDDARTAGHAIARRIAANSPTAVAQTLRLQRAMGEYSQLRETLADADETLYAHWSHPDASEGPKAWVERRQPCWHVEL